METFKTNPILRVEGVSKRFHHGSAYAVSDVSLALEGGELLALVGESGSGKTTLLRIIAGLEHPDSGVIALSGQTLVSGKKSIPANRRGIGMLFQDYALFPHLTVFENIAFGLQGKTRAAKEETVKRMLSVAGLRIDAARYPHELSGGQQQRVALARALAAEPGLLLLDEPFSNLDTILRDQVRDDVREIISKTATTTILVTHDSKDALGIADRIAVMDKGALLQCSQPAAIYRRPANDYVARLFGKFNVIEATVSGDAIQTPFGAMPLADAGPGFAVEGLSQICFRPEQAGLARDNRDALVGILRSRAFCGDRWQLRLSSLAGYADEAIYIDCGSEKELSIGDEIRFRLRTFDRWEG